MEEGGTWKKVRIDYIQFDKCENLYSQNIQIIFYEFAASQN